MAWTEQCKLAFCNTAENLYIKNGNKGIVKIIKQISRESDVPFETLKRWYYQEKKIVKNDKVALEGKDEKPICPLCETRTCERKKRKDGTWYYYDFCKKCRRGEEKVEVVCPHCNKTIKLKKKEVCL